MLLKISYIIVLIITRVTGWTSSSVQSDWNSLASQILDTNQVTGLMSALALCVSSAATAHLEAATERYTAFTTIYSVVRTFVVCQCIRFREWHKNFLVKCVVFPPLSRSCSPPAPTTSNSVSAVLDAEYFRNRWMKQQRESRCTSCTRTSDHTVG